MLMRIYQLQYGRQIGFLSVNPALFIKINNHPKLRNQIVC